MSQLCFFSRDCVVPFEPGCLCRDPSTPPGNQLEALRGDRKGQHSIRINDQWRICHVWRGGRCHDVEIVDYH